MIEPYKKESRKDSLVNKVSKGILLKGDGQSIKESYMVSFTISLLITFWQNKWHFEYKYDDRVS